jgi:hypothetical protein
MTEITMNTTAAQPTLVEQWRADEPPDRALIVLTYTRSQP